MVGILSSKWPWSKQWGRGHRKVESRKASWRRLRLVRIEGWTPRGGTCLARTPPHHHHLCQSTVAQGLLTWGSDPGVRSMAQRATANPLGFEGEQRGRPQLVKPLPCPAVLCSLAWAGARFAVGIATWRRKRRTYIRGRAEGWRARPLGLVKLWGPAPHPSLSPPAWT